MNSVKCHMGFSWQPPCQHGTQELTVHGKLFSSHHIRGKKKDCMQGFGVSTVFKMLLSSSSEDLRGM